MKLFLIFLAFFVAIVKAENQTFVAGAAQIHTFVIPRFSNSSSFLDFNNTLNLILEFPFNGDDSFLHIFMPPRNYSYGTFFDEKQRHDIWELSKSFDSFTDFIQIAQAAALEGRDFCRLSGNCDPKRYNFVILTDFNDFSNVTENFRSEVRQSFYFAILSSNNNLECINPKDEDFPFQCYSMLKGTKSIETDILQYIVYYTVDPVDSNFNYFMICDEIYFITYLLVPIFIQKEAEINMMQPILFVISISRNETYFYESIALYTGNFTLLIAALEFNNSPTPQLSTNLAETYMTQLYESDKSTFYLNQWNVIVTDRFPFWVKDTQITFDSFDRNLDIYFCSPNDTEQYDENLEILKKHMNDIILDDGNSSRRANHIQTLDYWDATLLSRQYFPSGRLFMPTKIFKYQTNTTNKWWIWAAVGSGFALATIIAIVAFLFWRRRMQRIFAEKYFWAVQAGFTQKEAQIFVEKGKELFIDESFIEVDFETIKGKGSSAIVYEGFMNADSPITALQPCMETQRFSACKVAVKIVNKYGKDDYEQIFREVEAAMKLGWHRHICCLLGWTFYQSTPSLIYEIIDGSDLHNWIRGFSNSPELIPEKQIAQILWQISDGMEHISAAGLVHKDLAARNILLNSAFVTKITDFGLASACDESFTYQAPMQRRLPLRWMAPETLSERIFSEASDVWSFGILTWEIFTKGAIPYGSIDGNDILEFLNSGKRLELPERGVVSTQWKKLLSQCWKERKEERPTFKDIKLQLSVLLETFTEDYGYLSLDD